MGRYPAKQQNVSSEEDFAETAMLLAAQCMANGNQK
jgi:hypothetical protein